MANKLKNMHLTSVDLVRNGANQEADICLFKSAEETPTQPTAEEKNIFKRFLNWLRENHAEEDSEPEDPIEKADEEPDLVDVYKNAITESIQSITADETLSASEKYDMIAKSLDEYHEAMLDLLDLAKAAEDEEEDDEDETDDWEEDGDDDDVDKSADIYDIEDIEEV